MTDELQKLSELFRHLMQRRRDEPKADIIVAPEDVYQTAKRLRPEWFAPPSGVSE